MNRVDPLPGRTLLAGHEYEDGRAMDVIDGQSETEGTVWEVLHGVIDPEVGINIVDLGLVYGVTVNGDDVRVTMTLTTPGCPLHETIAEAVETSIRYFVSDVESVEIDLVWEPAWSPHMITEAGQQALGWHP